MIRKAIIVVLTLGAVGIAVLWLCQLRGPVEFCAGPEFLDAKWIITDDVPGRPGWGMYEPTGTKDVFSTTGGLPWGAVEVPEAKAPPLDFTLPKHSLLLGVGYGGLHLGRAYFGPVPNPTVPPAPGMVYVTSQHRAIVIPLWCLGLLTAAYPAIAFIRGPVRRWRRRWKGLCIACGYDLTGNVTGVCPECGCRTCLSRPVGDVDEQKSHDRRIR